MGRLVGGTWQSPGRGVAQQAMWLPEFYPMATMVRWPWLGMKGKPMPERMCWKLMFLDFQWLHPPPLPVWRDSRLKCQWLWPFARPFLQGVQMECEGAFSPLGRFAEHPKLF
ncbi:hypothetical protein [Mumia zhuanghuii]|uniref:Uncharacterized protein n=1 Tax=Mumia zhuanghuii TaxID=2585211 RepID=A0A5C4M1S5_9ACTN|nr:hypothetical protein [Mumia zhuanghuii]TNC26838.1 hypothetical protein FHE65_34420 [Mumia zhuanghuii]